VSNSGSPDYIFNCVFVGMMVDSDLAVELAPLDYAEIESRNSLVHKNLIYEMVSLQWYHC